MDSFPKISPKTRKATPKAKPIVAYGVVALLAGVSVITLAVLSAQRSSPKRKVAQVTRTPARPAIRKKSAGPRVAPEASNSPVIPDLPNMQELLGDTLKRMPSVEQGAERPKPPQTPTTRPGPAKAVRPAEAKRATEKKATAQTTKKDSPADTQRPDAQTSTAQATSSLAAEYEAMIRDEKQRTCSEVFCSLERLVLNGSVVPQPGTSDVPLKKLVEERFHVVIAGHSHEADSFHWDWPGGGARVPLTRWQEVCGHTTAKPFTVHDPWLDKWQVQSITMRVGHMGEMAEIPFQCVDGVLYLVGNLNEMPAFGKIFTPQVVLVKPSADPSKRAEGDKLKVRFQIQPKQTVSKPPQEKGDNLDGCPRGASAEYQDGYGRMIGMAKAFDRERKDFRERIGDSPHPSIEEMLVSGTEKRRMYLYEQLETFENMLGNMPKGSPNADSVRGMADGCRYGLRYILKSEY